MIFAMMAGGVSALYMSCMRSILSLLQYLSLSARCSSSSAMWNLWWSLPTAERYQWLVTWEIIKMICNNLALTVVAVALVPVCIWPLGGGFFALETRTRFPDQLLTANLRFLSFSFRLSIWGKTSFPSLRLFRIWFQVSWRYCFCKQCCCELPCDVWKEQTSSWIEYLDQGSKRFCQ